jgi:hypothetical protein
MVLFITVHQYCFSYIYPDIFLDILIDISQAIYFLVLRERGRERKRRRRRIDPEILHLSSLHYTKNTLNKRNNTYLFSI